MTDQENNPLWDNELGQRRDKPTQEQIGQLSAAPQTGLLTSERPRQLLVLSARTPSVLAASSTELASYFAKSAQSAFADAAFTLQVGRKMLKERRFAVASDPREAAKLLLQPHPQLCGSKRLNRRGANVSFLFGGEGTHYVNMGWNFYRDEQLFRTVVNDCCEQLALHLGRNLCELLYPESGNEEMAARSLQEPSLNQPSIFVIEYALARLWQAWGVQPAMMLGQGIGEFVAATLAGVWELADALRIVAVRGKLMQNQPPGSMLAVKMPADGVKDLLPTSLQIASIASPSLCVVSGPYEEVALFGKTLQGQGITYHNLCASHAFYSAMMDPVVEPLRAEVAKLRLQPPTRPFMSAATGKPISADQAIDPGYWARTACAPILYSKSVRWLVDWGYDLFLECGPGSTSCMLARQHFAPDCPCVAVPSLGDTAASHAEWNALLFALGTLWLNGVSIDWDAFHALEKRRRIPLPPFLLDQQRYAADFGVDLTTFTSAAAGAVNVASTESEPLAESKSLAPRSASTVMLRSESGQESFQTFEPASADARLSKLEAVVAEQSQKIDRLLDLIMRNGQYPAAIRLFPNSAQSYKAIERCNSRAIEGIAMMGGSAMGLEPAQRSSRTLPCANGDDATMLNAMLDIWRRALDVPRVEADDDFFELGGHPIVAARLFTMIERELGFKAPMKLQADCFTPRELVILLTRGKLENALR